jgi:hypothetical protein
MSRADKFLDESYDVGEIQEFSQEDIELFNEVEESVVSYIDDRGGICVLEDGNWCFSDELEELEEAAALDEATIRKGYHGSFKTVHTLTGSRKSGAIKAGRKNIKHNMTTMKKKAHNAASERLRRRTMEKLGIWKRGGAAKKPAATTTPHKPAASKNPMGSRMKSRM